MHRAASLCLAASVGLAACSRRAPPLDGAPGASASAFATASASAPPPLVTASAPRSALADAYRGTMDPDILVAMRLERRGDALDGSYFYEARGADIALSGAIDSEGFLSLTETTAGKTTGTFRVTAGPSGELDGTWSGAQGGRRAVHLEPVERHPGGPAIVLKKWHRSHRRPKSPPLPGARILQCNLDLAYPEVFGLGDAKIEATINEKLRAAQLGHRDEECDAPFAMNGSYAVHQNRAGVLSVSYTYDSACEQCAHSVFGGAAVDVVVDTGATLPLEALFVPGGRTKLIPLLSAPIAARIKATPGATVDDVLTLRNAYLSGDYVLEDKGLRLIAFFRLPHAVQALDGDFGVLLPWPLLTPLLDPKSPATRVWAP